jgi:Uma2 family endonuclease
MGERAMTVAAKKMTFEEFLNYEDGTDTLYELENGKLISIPSESDINQRIAIFLLIYFSQLGIPSSQLRMKAEVAVNSRRVGVRVPDLVVFSEELAIAKRSVGIAMVGATRSLVYMDMPPPLLVVEVVSPNQASRDYRYKRSEYAARGIAEYWIVDPIDQKVTVLEWVEGFYEQQVYENDSLIVSPLFPDLKLTAAQVLLG